MPSHQISIVLAKKAQEITINSFGEGNIPLLIVGHAVVYFDILKKTFTQYGLDKIFTVYAPQLYWCEGEPLAQLPIKDITANGLVGLADHVEQVRQGLAKLNLLETTDGKIGLYSHSGFSALAFETAADFPDNILFIHADCPPPFFGDEWAMEKKLFFDGNFRRKNDTNDRAKALDALGLSADQSAVDEKNMTNSSTYIQAYHKMAPTIFYNFNHDYLKEIWGEHKLNVAMMRAYFYEILVGYHCKNSLTKVDCPIMLSLGVYDTPVPFYLWTDPKNVGGVGFFETKTRRDYVIHTTSAHWPALEEPQNYCKAFENFIQQKITPYLNPKPSYARSV